MLMVLATMSDVQVKSTSLCFQPSNIFFALDGTVKVGDFGLVTAAENLPESGDQSPASKASVKHTAEVGTQLYMSPEQVQCTLHNQDTSLRFHTLKIDLELIKGEAK